VHRVDIAREEHDKLVTTHRDILATMNVLDFIDQNADFGTTSGPPSMSTIGARHRVIERALAGIWKPNSRQTTYATSAPSRRAADLNVPYVAVDAHFFYLSRTPEDAAQIAAIQKASGYELVNLIPTRRGASVYY
jgi:hypothetical protein